MPNREAASSTAPSPRLRVAFAGTPEFAAAHLAALIAAAKDSALAGYELVAVYTQPDRPAGRGKKLAPSPVKRVAEDAGCTTVDGLGMLLHQAVPGFERWFGKRPDVDETTRAAVLR